MRHRWTTTHQSFVVCTRRGFWIPPSLPTSLNSLAARGEATMFNAPCGVRSSVSERKPSTSGGLFYMKETRNNDFEWIKKHLFWLLSERLLPECGLFADHLPRSCLSLSPWTLTGTADKDKCHNGKRSLSSCFLTGRKKEKKKAPDHFLSIHIGYMLRVDFSFSLRWVFLRTVFLPEERWLTAGRRRAPAS